MTDVRAVVLSIARFPPHDTKDERSMEVRLFNAPTMVTSNAITLLSFGRLIAVRDVAPLTPKVLVIV